MTVTLYEGDCVEIVPTFPPQSVDAIITDIPYGTTACKWDTIIPFHDFMTINGKQYEKDVAFDLLVDHYSLSEDEAAEKWSREHKPGMWRIVKHVLKPRGAFVTTARQPFTSVLVCSNLEMFRYEWIWRKSHAANFMNAKYMPLIKHENILVFADKSTKYNPQTIAGKHQNRSGAKLYDRQNGSIYDSKPAILENITVDKFQPISVIEYSAGARMNMIHPTQKPVALYEYLIKTYTNEGDTVLDIAMGSGTTGIACQNTGRNFIGIEKDAAIFKTAEKRINEN